MFRLVLKIALKLPKAQNFIAPNAITHIQRSHFTANAKASNEEPQNLENLIENLKMRTAENKPISPKHLDFISYKLDMENANPNQTLILLQSCRSFIDNENQRDKVLSIWMKLMKNKTFAFTSKHYACAMPFYQTTGDIDGAEATLEEMQKNKIKISPTVYQIMLQMYCKAVNIEKVNEWIDRISDAKLHLSEFSYNHLTQFYLKCEDIEMANHTMEIIKLNNFTIHFHTLNEFVKYFARNGDAENVIKTLDSFEESKMNIRNKCVIDAIYESAANGHIEQIDSFVGHLDTDFIAFKFLNATITRFVENGQGHVVPKFLSLIARNLKQSLEFFVRELQRVNTTPEQFKKIIEGLKVAGIDVSLQISLETNEPKRASNSKNVEQSVKITYNSLDTDDIRFQKFVQEKNVVEVEKIAQEGILQMNPSRSALLIQMYTDLKDLEKAMETLKGIRTRRKSFRLDSVKVAKLIKLMIEKDRTVEEILDLIKTNRQDEVKHVHLYEEIFELLTQTENVALLDRIHKPLIDYNHVPKSDMPKYLVMIHMKKGDFKQAVDVFEKFLNKSNLIPLALRLFRQLINKEETKLLKRLYDVLEKACGRSFAHYNLAMALVKCGLVHKATKIFDSGTINNLSHKLDKEMTVFERFEYIEEAKHLLDATTEKHCDRHKLYRTILQIYRKRNQINEAIQLWNDHANDSVKPNEEFRRILTNFLKTNDRPIPIGLKSETE